MFVSLAFPLFNSDIEKIVDVHIDVPPESSIGDVLQKLLERPDVPDGTRLRMLALAKCQIIRVLGEDESIGVHAGLEVRVEFVPEHQFDMSGGFLMKCAYSHSFKYPPNGCFGRPFLLRIDTDEPFDLTQCKIDSLIGKDFGDLQYQLDGGPNFSPQRFCILGDGAILSALPLTSAATLYIMVTPQALYALARRLPQRSLKIG
jgi:hypothetical protein